MPSASDQPTSPPSKPAVLLVLDERERHTFLSLVDDSSRATVGPWIDSPRVQEPGAWQQLLEEVRPTVLVSSWSTPAIPASWLNHADCPLSYVCHLGGAVRHLLPRSFFERGGIATNWGGAAAAQVAEHALLLTLASLRKMPDWPSAGNASEAPLFTQTLFNRRVGIHGCGGVARHLARLLAPFAPQILCWSAGVPESVVRASQMQPADSLEALFSSSEILIECEALSPANRHSVGARQLALLADGAHLVNVGRGHVIDEAALLAEVSRGRLHVALDVMWKEPIPPDSPWWTAPHTVLSPHIAGPTRDETPQIGLRAWENLQRFLAGQPVENAVTLAIYDRAT